MYRETKRWGWATRVALLVALAMTLAGCVDLSGQEATGQAFESPLKTPLSTSTLEVINLITPPYVPPPPPTPTPRPWPAVTPAPLRTPAPDAAGLIIYATVDDPTSAANRVCTVYSLPVDGAGRPLGEPQKLTTFERCFQMQASPDGRYLLLPQATADGMSRPFICDIKEGRLWSVFAADSPAAGITYGWHSDSRHILVGSSFTLDEGLWLVDIHSGEYSVLAGGVVPNTGAAVSPDGSKVMYVDNDRVMLISLDGTRREQLDVSVGYLLGWTPDAQRTFHKTVTGVWVTDIERASYARIDQDVVQQDTVLETTGATWSPDGQTVAVTKVLPRPKGSDIDWGAWLVANGNIYLVDTSERNMRPLLPEGQGVSPTWSPDGKLLAFLSDRSGSTELWVANVDGTDLRQMTQTKPNEFFVASYPPLWIPIGR
jgi:Tol biopolymer transport system component